jgi:hypothetical protein
MASSAFAIFAAAILCLKLCFEQRWKQHFSREWTALPHLKGFRFPQIDY